MDSNLVTHYSRIISFVDKGIDIQNAQLGDGNRRWRWCEEGKVVAEYTLGYARAREIMGSEGG